MPIDDLTALGQKMREARKNKELTQQELSDLSHVSVKQIANIEKGKMNPSYLILRALAKVLHISLDTLINPDISLEDEGVNHVCWCLPAADRLRRNAVAYADGIPLATRTFYTACADAV